MRKLLATYLVGIVCALGLSVRFGLVWHRLCRCVITVIARSHAYLFDQSAAMLRIACSSVTCDASTAGLGCPGNRRPRWRILQLRYCENRDAMAGTSPGRQSVVTG